MGRFNQDVISDKIRKMGWYFKDIKLPRLKRPSSVNFCIHTEVIYKEDVYEALLKFAEEFHDLTGKKTAICVATPDCPLVGYSMKERGFPEEEFAQRVLNLSKFAEIGYHGHFYRREKTGLIQISDNNFDNDLVCRQIGEEFAWFKDIGILPKIYVAGWWFLKEGIVLELERQGIVLDISVRKGKANTFGGSYLEDYKIPDYGKPFILPPSKNVLEIQSLFGPVMPPAIMKGHLIKFLDKGYDDLFFIFPLHDWDIPKYYRNLLANIKELNRFTDSVKWMNLFEMRGAFLDKRPQ